MTRKNLDTQGTGEKAVAEVKRIILKCGHLFQEGNGSIDQGIDGYIRLRKYTQLTQTNKNGKKTLCEDFVETGNLVGVQIKGVTRIPASGASSYYIHKQTKTEFGVNFGDEKKLSGRKKIWQNFIAPVILIFVDLETEKIWWGNLNNEAIYDANGYSITLKKDDELNQAAFKKISKLGRELFVTKALPTINAKEHSSILGMANFKDTAKAVYKNLSDLNASSNPIENPTLGRIHFSKSGWKHITRLNRKKSRIFNSLFLLPVCKAICQTVEQFSNVKKGEVRESCQYIKKVDFLTLRANVEFDYRQKGIVQVVLRRVKTFDKIDQTRVMKDQIYFHSVYEPFRIDK
ncbi:DUF4365 domain-containing protein [Pedobacter panaciterrae]